MKKNWGNRTYYLLSQGKQRIWDSQLSPSESWQLWYCFINRIIGIWNIFIWITWGPFWKAISHAWSVIANLYACSNPLLCHYAPIWIRVKAMLPVLATLIQARFQFVTPDAFIVIEYLKAMLSYTSMGWFHGFKLHFTVNEQGELLSFYVTPGNVDDRNPVPHLAKSL